jgi:hypothetical protein
MRNEERGVNPTDSATTTDEEEKIFNHGWDRMDTDGKVINYKERKDAEAQSEKVRG